VRTGHRILIPIALIVIGAVFAAAHITASAQTTAVTPVPNWQMKLPERIEYVSVAPDAACVAARTASRIHVIYRSGRKAWDATLKSSAQFPIQKHAVSPTCDWIAVFTTADDHASFGMEIIRMDGTRKSLSLASADGVNGPLVQSAEISPDGKLLVIGFESNYLWIVSRGGAIQARLGPLQASGVSARFTADSTRVLLTGFFSTGMMDLKGKWDWKSESRELIASRNFNLIAGLTAPMHGPQGGDIVILDGDGRFLWKDFAWDASMAIAPNGKFVVFTRKTVSANQPKEPPFPISPVLNNTPEISIRDRVGKELANGPFAGRLAGVSSDSSCVLVRWGRYSPTQPMPPTRDWLAGLDRSLKEVWRWNIESFSPFSEVNSNSGMTSDLVFDWNGDTVRAYRIPSCNP